MTRLGVKADDLAMRTVLNTPFSKGKAEELRETTQPYSIFVYNQKVVKNPNDYFPVARGSELGNPFTHMELSKTTAKYRVGGRDEAVLRFAQYAALMLESGAWNLNTLRLALSGQNLLCWCHPEFCHADVIAYLVNSDCTIAGFKALVF